MLVELILLFAQAFRMNCVTVAQVRFIVNWDKRASGFESYTCGAFKGLPMEEMDGDEEE